MAVNDLTSKRCRPCESGEAPLTPAQTGDYLQALNSDWSVDEDGKEISRTFRFKDYYQTMAFVNALAWIAHAEDHHPDIEVSYNRCHVRFSTHSIGGLSENDFISAAKLDVLLPATS